MNTIFNRNVRHCGANCAAFELQGKIEFKDMYPVVVNPKPETEIVQTVAIAIVGENKVSEQGLPRTDAKDFAYFLQARPGCFFFIGTKHEVLLSCSKSNHLQRMPRTIVRIAMDTATRYVSLRSAVF